MNYQIPRGALARAIYDKYHNDYHLDKYNTQLVCKLLQFILSRKLVIVLLIYDDAFFLYMSCYNVS